MSTGVPSLQDLALLRLAQRIDQCFDLSGLEESLTCCLFEATIRSGKLNPRSESWLLQAHTLHHTAAIPFNQVCLCLQGSGYV